MSPNYCPNCGCKLHNEPNYCPECGHQFATNKADQRNAAQQNICWSNLKKAVREVDEDHQTWKKRRDEWHPRYPILSVFAAVMLFWAGFNSLTGSGSPSQDFALFSLLGIAIIPRVRKVLIETVRSGLDIDLTGSAVKLLTVGVYILFVGAATLLMIGEAVNDPQMTAGAGVLSVVIAFIVAVVIVYIARGIGSRTTP